MVTAMVKAMNARITVIAPGREPLILRMPESVHIEKSWRMLTDIATVTLPRAVPFLENENIRQVFAVGAEIEIELGFNMKLESKFKGYITSVSDELPLTISCEDEMWLLKKEPVHTATKETYLPDFISSITSANIKAVAPYELGALRYANSTTAKVLESLQEKLNLYSYFDNGQLVVGEIYADDNEEPALDFNLDLAVDGGNNLTFEDRENNPVKITAVSTLKDGSKIEVTVGDEDGLEQRTAYYNITSKEQLRKLATEDLRKFNVSRYVGAFEAYGDFNVNHGSKVNLTSYLYEDEITSTYYVDKVVIDFDSTPRYRVQVGLDELVQV
jgi:hypothetical protein